VKYLIIDELGNIENVIAWDGVSPYDPGDGLQLIGVEGAVAVSPGDSWDGLQVVPAPMPEPPPAPVENPAKVSARAKLAAIGLTEEEITALIG
jgi:hypothetical protein